VGRFGAMIGPILAGFLFDRKWPVDQVFDVYAIPMIIGGVAILVMYLTYREPKIAVVSSAVVGGMAPASRGSR
jgi:MFS family permease